VPSLGFARGEAGEDEEAMVVSRGQERSRAEPSAVRGGHGAPASNRHGVGVGERGEKGLKASSPRGETPTAAGHRGEAAALQALVQRRCERGRGARES
jgi:hypothetical protein